MNQNHFGGYQPSMICDGFCRLILCKEMTKTEMRVHTSVRVENKRKETETAVKQDH